MTTAPLYFAPGGYIPAHVVGAVSAVLAGHRVAIVAVFLAVVAGVGVVAFTPVREVLVDAGAAVFTKRRQ